MYFDKRLMSKLLIDKDRVLQTKRYLNKAQAIQEVVNEYCSVEEVDIEEFYDIGLGDEVDDLIETLRDLDILMEL